jgi:glycosyltransferase involved in cell wall biosynthesis
VRWILDELRESPPDVFVPNLIPAGFFAGRWVRAAGIPTVGILHSDDDYYRAIQDEFIFGAEKNRISAVVCVSRELEHQVRDRKPVHTIVRRIPYGVPLAAWRDEPGSNGLKIAYVGRLSDEQKRITDVTRALCRATAVVPGAQAIILGDGPDRGAVERIIEDAGPQSSVRLVGAVPGHAVQEELRSCDVITLLSDYEGLPIALLEGMASGCVPVTCRMRSGIPELVEHAVTGLIVEDRSHGFVSAIRRLNDDPALLKRLRSAARVRIEREFSQDASTESWASLFRELAPTHRVSHSFIPPKRFSLPRRNGNLESQSARDSGPSLPELLYRRGRMFAGRLRRRLTSIAPTK